MRRAEPSRVHAAANLTTGVGPRPGLNRLRAGVLGANDGIVSTAALVVGVAGATTSRATLLTAGVAGLVAGAVSMALGEYVSVSSARDSERSLLAKERRELADHPDLECAELARIYRGKGLSAATAMTVARELTERDAFAAHADAEFGIDPEVLTNPWHAAAASGLSFVLGALLPMVAILTLPPQVGIPVTFAVVLVTLAVTGTVSATIGGAHRARAVVRVVMGGALGMAIAYAVGGLLGSA